MNSIQKAAVFSAATLLVILVVLHSPWTGYETEQQILVDSNSTMLISGEKWPVSDWHSAEPVARWFGGLVNFIVVAVALAGLTGLLCYLYRTPKNGIERSENGGPDDA